MKELIIKLWNSVKRVFTVVTSNPIIATLLENEKHSILKELHDADLGKRAMEFVKELNARTDIDNSKKAEIFNEKLMEYGKLVGKQLTTLAINTIRELAVLAVKVEISKLTKGVA